LTALPLAEALLSAARMIASVNGLVTTSWVSQFRPEARPRWSAYVVISKTVTPG